MAREAQIIGKAVDIWGDEWDVREARGTKHGFDVLLGWPHGQPRGRGGSGAARVIVTPELAAHLEAFRKTGGQRRGGVLDLPVGKTVIKRLRRLLSHDYYVDTAAWWEERIDDLSDLTAEQFAAKHGVKPGAVVDARHHLLGHKLRPAGWWRTADTAAILLADRPRSEIADELGISVGSVGRLRWALKSVDMAGEMADSNRKYISSTTVAELKELLSNGHSITQATRRTGAARETIQRLIKQGVLPEPTKPPGGYWRYSDEIKWRAIDLIRAGKSYQQAAYDLLIETGFDIAPGSIRFWCLAAGVRSQWQRIAPDAPRPVRPKRRSAKTIERRKKALEMRAEGKTYKEIGRELNVSGEQARQYVRDAQKQQSPS